MHDTTVEEATARHVIATKSKEYMEAYFGFPIPCGVCVLLAGFVYRGLIEAGFSIDWTSRGRRGVTRIKSNEKKNDDHKGKIKSIQIYRIDSKPSGVP